MIPKIIHYCWFGGNPLPKDALKCIESWKKFCPDYKIKQWDESNTDFSDCKYALEAYSQKKWAFVSDYVRFKILYEYGGLYFDTDVELVKPIDYIVSKGPFMGCENNCEYNKNVNPGLGLGAVSGLSLYREIIDLYKKIHFKNNGKEDGYKTVVEYTTELLRKYGLKDSDEIQCVEGVYIYPKEFFQPMDRDTGIIHIGENTVSIHHYSASWCKKGNRFRGKIYQLLYRIFGKNVAEMARKIFGHH